MAAGAGSRSTCAPTTARSSPSPGPPASCSRSSAGPQLGGPCSSEATTSRSCCPSSPATPPRRSSDCSAASPTSWRTSPRPTTKFPRPFAPSAPTGASINRSRPTHRARLHPRQALIALGPTRRVLHLVFDLFERRRTLQGVLQSLVAQEIRLPCRVISGLAKGELEWHRPNRATLSEMLHNPLYAGAYSYGRRRRSQRCRGGRATAETPVLIKG